MYFVEAVTREEFIAYSENAKKNNYLQTIQMADLKEKLGQKVFLIGLKNEYDQLVYATLLTKMKIRIGYVFTISGFELEPLESHFNFFIDQLKLFIKKNKGTYLTIEANTMYHTYDSSGTQLDENTQSTPQAFLEKNFTWEKPTPAASKHGNPCWIYEKDITGMDEKSLESSYKKTALYSLKKTKQFGITVRSIAYEELPIFKKITEATSERREFDDKPLSYYQKLYNVYGEKAKFLVAELNIKEYLNNLLEQEKKLNSDILKIDEYLETNTNMLKKSTKKKINQKKELLAQKETYNKRITEALMIKQDSDTEQVVLACALFILCPQETVYLFSGTVEQYKNMYAPFLIQDEMLRYSVKNHIPKYNFYGIEGTFNSEDGILKFKESFNGVAVELMGDFTFVASPIKYTLYTSLKTLIAKLKRRG